MFARNKSEQKRRKKACNVLEPFQNCKTHSYHGACHAYMYTSYTTQNKIYSSTDRVEKCTTISHPNTHAIVFDFDIFFPPHSFCFVFVCWFSISFSLLLFFWALLSFVLIYLCEYVLVRALFSIWFFRIVCRHMCNFHAFNIIHFNLLLHLWPEHKCIYIFVVVHPLALLFFKNKFS